MGGNSGQDGGPWGLGRWFSRGSNVEASAPPVIPQSSSVPYPPAPPPNSSTLPDGLPILDLPSQKYYPTGSPPYPPEPRPISSPYSPYHSHGNLPHTTSQGNSAHGHSASYGQISDPTSSYGDYTNSPSQLQGGGYVQPGSNSIPMVPPQLQEPGGPYSQGSAHAPSFQTEPGNWSPQSPSCPPGPTYSNNSSMSRESSNRITSMSESRLQSTARSLLHGTLEATIFEAVKLPNMDMFSERVRQFAANLPGPLEKMKAKAKLHAPNVAITSDPYTTVVLAGAKVARTRVINNDANPQWNEHFLVPVAHHVYEIVFTVKDQDVLGSQYIGDVRIPVEDVLGGGVVEGWFDLTNPHGKPRLNGAKMRLSVCYTPVETNWIYTQGVGSDSHGVPFTYFPLRKGCRLTLYQDAHVYDNTLPDIILDGGMVYEHGRCWEDICVAINDAQHLVYITGWSVYDKIRLVRDRKRPFPEVGNLTLGELLKKKASQGVRVLVLAWADKSSHDYGFVKTGGVMETHDEETKKFFKNSGVRCVLASRYGASKMTWVRQRVVGTLFTHHQKSVIVDSGPRERRNLISFVGGLDLCGGRWDTPSHFLFASLEDEHKNDFRNKAWEFAPNSGGPREPWHDLHCKIEGHAAYDVLTNFEQRWKRATRKYDDDLLDIDRCDRLLGPSNRAPLDGDPSLFLSNDYDPETWHVQVFRSIDSGSVKGFPKLLEEVQKQNLVWTKSVAMDISIQMAYIKTIRAAQHFIYIENQYFLGSSYNWPDYDKAGANHLIPMELTLKICSKIREGKRFAVYVVIPMWPEGIPDSGAVQEILYFQTQTMKMMYTKIADALRDNDLSHRKPTDYLNFYCLGKRETKVPGEPAPTKPPDVNSKQANSQIHRRMMIYVHSKGMIVDDEMVIIGSANINQRSMDGSRDTEIAMGGYQPNHTWVHKMEHPRGQVYGYRMSLWAEHLGYLDYTFEEPESLECVQKVNESADRNWQQFIAPEVTDMRGHLIHYPLKIEVDGTIRNLPGYETFPDVGGKIMGTNHPDLPDDLTT